MTFRFSYTIEQTKDCINETERQLRDLISSVMTSKHGPGWEGSSAGWDSQTRQALEERRNEEQARFPHQPISDRLLDFCDIKDLKELVLRNWSQFAPLLGSKDRTRILFDELGKLRNPEMHSRPGILPHQRYLCLGICGEFLLAIHNWRQGHAHQIQEYEADLRFPVYAGDRDEAEAQAEAQALAQRWLERVVHETGGRLEEKSADEHEKVWLLRLQRGHVRIQMRWNYRGYDGRNFRAADITITSANRDALDRVLQAGGSPYWVLKWSLSDDLDVASSADQASEQAGRAPISSGRVRIGGGPETLTNASYKLDAAAGGNIRLDLSRAAAGSRASISLVYDGVPDRGFYSAHQHISISQALRILYGEVTPVHAHQLLADSITQQSESH